MKKIYVLDTNVPLFDINVLDKFEDNDIVFPTTVIKELNNHKKRMDEIGKNARLFTHLLESFDGNIYQGVSLKEGGTLKIEPIYGDILKEIEEMFYERDNDDKILSVAVGLHRKYLKQKNKLEKELMGTITDDYKNQLKEEITNLKPVILVTRDSNLRLRARGMGIVAQNYAAEQVKNINELYEGWRIVPVNPQIISEYYLIKQNSQMEDFSFNPNPNRWDFRTLELYPNEYIILVDKEDWNDTEEERKKLFESLDSPVLRFDEKRNSLVGLTSYKNYLNEFNIYPKNLHQRMLVDLLFNKEVKQKSIIGLAGSGKTLFALLTSIIMVNKLEWFDEIIITRPPIEAEYELGFLPGNEQEKMSPYLRGFSGNLKFINSQRYNFKSKNKDKYKEKEKEKDKEKEDKKEEFFTKYKITTESMGYMRGETTHRQIMIIDETQNSTKNAMKTALTRIGEDSIVIIMGDISQIDFHILDATNNGLSHAVELMKDDLLAGHITLVKGERSRLSEAIANKWDKFNN